ncbi:MAG: uracil phosphoribosyltransferase [Alphaproteobacteria bacterium]
MIEHPDFKNLFIVDHPLVQHKLSMMRFKGCEQKQFRAYLKEISLLMGYEITRGLALTTRKIETPLTMMDAPVLDGDRPAIVPILRAGLGMSEGLNELMPSAVIGHIGLYRDHETHQPHEYLVKLPSAKNRKFILVDPMLATGNSAVHAVQVLERHGVKPSNVMFMALVAAPEGVAVFRKSYADIPVYTAALDEKLNEKAYIVPGLGDAGDRLFGTL